MILRLKGLNLCEIGWVDSRVKMTAFPFWKVKWESVLSGASIGKREATTVAHLRRSCKMSCSCTEEGWWSEWLLVVSCVFEEANENLLGYLSNSMRQTVLMIGEVCRSLHGSGERVFASAVKWSRETLKWEDWLQISFGYLVGFHWSTRVSCHN